MTSRIRHQLPWLSLGLICIGFVIFAINDSRFTGISSLKTTEDSFPIFDEGHRSLRFDPKSIVPKTPKIIHFTVADDPPVHQMKVIEFSKKIAESYGFQVMVHSDTDAQNMIYHQFPNLVPSWERVKHTEGITKGARVGDYVRLLLIYHYGGIYLDSDMVVCKDLSPITDAPGVATFPLVNSLVGGVVNAVFAGPPHHIVFRYALQQMSTNGKLDTQAIIRATGPKQLGDTLDTYFEDTGTKPIVKFSEHQPLPEPEDGGMWLYSGAVRLGAVEGNGSVRVRGLGTLGPLGLIHFHFGSWVEDGPRVDHKHSKCDTQLDLIEPFLREACAIGEVHYNRRWSDCGSDTPHPTVSL